VRTARSSKSRATPFLGAAGFYAWAILTACQGETAVPVGFGEPIPIGAYTLTIQRSQPAPRPGPPVSSFRERPGREGYLVFVQWSGLDALDPISRLVFTEEYLDDRLAVVDSTGGRHEPTDAMQAALLFMNDPGDNWRDWIVLFHLPEEGGGWILEVENPEPAEGQPARFSVDLTG
jgi:hypothetical protein